jgi:NAD(P)-dependent dehydrogenase (short-subunit alcohol dehydrogenase family)
VQADVSSEEQVKAMVAKTIEAFGRLDVLVNNAGIQKPGASHEIEAADFDRVLLVNLRGPFLCSREAIRHFLSRPGKSPVEAAQWSDAQDRSPPRNWRPKSPACRLIRC